MALLFVLLAGAGALTATGLARTGVTPTGRACADERSDSGRFEVVLGLTKSRKRADALAAKARSLHLSARVENETCKTFEVAVGRARTRNLARLILSRAKLAGFRHATIEADPVITPGTTTTTTGSPDTTTTTTAGGGGGGGGAQSTTTTVASTPTTTTTQTPPPPPCTVHPKPDDHDVFEVVFGRTETFAAAQVLMARTHDAGFQTGIEVDSCTEYEVAIARDLSRAEALVLLADAQRAGFSQAGLERS